MLFWAKGEEYNYIIDDMERLEWQGMCVISNSKIGKKSIKYWIKSHNS